MAWDMSTDARVGSYFTCLRNKFCTGLGRLGVVRVDFWVRGRDVRLDWTTPGLGSLTLPKLDSWRVVVSGMTPARQVEFSNEGSPGLYSPHARDASQLSLTLNFQSSIFRNDKCCTRDSITSVAERIPVLASCNHHARKS